MRTVVYPLALLAAFLAAPAVHASGYLSNYPSGGGRYLSDYASGSYNPGSQAGYIRGSRLTSGIGNISRGGAGRIDRSGATRTRTVIVQPAPAHDPCGIYNRAPTYPCRMSTMAANPNASVSRTGGGFNVPFLNQLPPYFGPRRGYGSYFSTITVQRSEF